MENPNIVVALCYPGANNYTIVPSCPFCFCRHKHRVPDISLSIAKHCNGDIVPYNEDMFVKVSECLFHAHTYALELHEEENIPKDESPQCRGITAKGTECKRKARKWSCVCKQHFSQLEDIILERVEKLFGS